MFGLDVRTLALAVGVIAMSAATVLGLAGRAEAQGAAPANAQVASFTGLDKITGRITEFDVWINETVRFGALQITPRACRQQTDGDAAASASRVISFIEVDEITLQAEIQRVFNGWMFAESPGLNAVEHPVYDFWLTGCKTAEEADIPAPQ